MRPSHAEAPQRLARERFACLLALVVVAGVAQASQASIAQLAKPLELVVYGPSARPPAFSGQTLDSKSLSIDALRGKVVIINFWASWCNECRPEMSALDQLHREFSARGLAVVGVNVREPPDAARRFAREVSTAFPLLLDPDGQINALYGVIGVPTTFVVARDGRAVAFAVGFRKWSSPAAKTLIEALLAEPLPR